MVSQRGILNIYLADDADPLLFHVRYFNFFKGFDDF